MRITRFRVRIGTMVLMCAALARPIQAAPITWIGGNADWNALNANWNPADEPDSTDEAIFNTPNSVNMANATDVIQSLTLSGGIDLDTNGNDITIDGTAQMIGAGTNFTIGGSTSQVTADRVEVNTSANLIMAGGALTVIEETGSGLLLVSPNGELLGNGTINLTDALAAPTTLFSLAGTLSASATGLIFIGAPPAGTLTINVSSANGRVDLDNGAASVVNVFRNQSLVINGTLSDPFGNDMNLYHNSTLNIRDPWELSNGTIDISNGFVAGTPPFIPNVPADVSYIAGGEFTQTGGTITVADNDGTLQFDAEFDQKFGTVANNGTVIFNANATIEPGAHFNMPTTSSSIVVNPGVNVTIDQSDFNYDGAASLSNKVTVEKGGKLTVNLGLGGDNKEDNTTTLNGGTLDLSTSTLDWIMDGVLNLNNNGAIPVVTGNELAIGNDAGSAKLNVTGSGVSQITPKVTFQADADVNIAAGATLSLVGNAFFNSVNGGQVSQFTGNGTLRLDGASNVIVETTTIDMSGGKVDLDGVAGVQTLTLTGNANLVLNVSAIDSFDNSFGKGGADTIVLGSFSVLRVNLTDPAGEWTLNSGAVLDINAIGGALGGGGIAGSDFKMAGTANISGNSIWTARTDITGTVNIAAGGSFSVRGGTLANTNRLQGGTIAGPGQLQALADEGLSGFGTISAPVEFKTNTTLLADDGTLTISGVVSDVGKIGTADTDGTLNMTNAWNTNIADEVELNGGRITGSVITNDLATGIVGFGEIDARVVNNSRLVAKAGTLTINNATSDYDGAANNASLVVDSGATMRIVDAAGFNFFGSANVTGGTLNASGFELRFASASDLALKNGKFTSNVATQFNGNIQVGGAPASEITVQTKATLGATSVTTLSGDLRLGSSLTEIVNGATFSGGGSLITVAGSTLQIDDAATVNVLIQNNGTMELGASPGQVSVRDFQQNASGKLHIELAGTGLNNFDRLDLTGQGQLDGTLDVSLLGGFNPVLGNTFTILTGSAITGSFSSVLKPVLSPGLFMNVVYNPTSVQLVISATLPCDLNSDGSIDAADAGIMFGNWGGAGVGDFNNDGIVDAADAGEMFSKWTGDAAPQAVPEPTGTGLLAAGVLGLFQLRRKRKGA